ncbi:MAG: hypothetical protein CVU51_07845 [Deltaproteobacteria bacterium HGW-Deltaproteobacteria-1]|nr:MAG: hypothetical protein CVU51_07845 [Deltaproteobacteria bacterium HGW-Deltaproteobacteria-1]
MANRIEVGFKTGIRDALGEKTKKRIIDTLALNVSNVATIEVYTIDGQLSAAELRDAASGPLSDPVIQEFSINRPLAKNFDWLIEVGFRPGVTDNVGKTAREAIELLLGGAARPGKINVYTSRQYLISGQISRSGAETIASGLLANDLIERHQVIAASDFDINQGLPAFIPKVQGEDKPQVAQINLAAVSAQGLLKISQEKLLALNLEEMQKIQAYYQNPAVIKARKKLGLDENTTDVELECLGQTWSEHCKHKIFNSKINYTDGRRQLTIDSLFKKYIKGSTAKIRKAKGRKDFCLSVFVDNAGVIKFNDGYNLVFKVETHNSPSALDPYGGALTGIVGVNRDPFGTGIGAKLIFNTDVFCFASPFHKKKLPPRILHPRRIYEGVREGVEHGGNKSGIPTVNGSIIFDERYLGKPLVYCGTAGIMPARINGRPSHTKEIRPGDIVIMTGGRIGKDGIHGATFSSEELHEGSPVTAVQIGDPITQKKVLGKFTKSGKFHVRFGSKTVAYLDMDFLHNGVPQMKLAAKWKAPKNPEPVFSEPADLGKALTRMLSRLNICSKESVVRQYDHEVQGGSVVKPLVGVQNDGPSDAGIVRPLLDSMEGVVVAHGICPRYSDIDAYHMTACAIDEAVRNAVAVGADLDHLAGLDNFCWCDPVKSAKTPDGEYKLAQLVRANMAIYDYTTAYGVPCISGKDSMKNDYSIGLTKISVPPTLLYSVIGKIRDVRKAVTMDAKRPQDLVYILGETRDELGGSEWFAQNGSVGSKVPQVDAKKAMKLYRALHKAIAAGLVASCHDCSDGGLGVALAETAFAGGMGMRIDLKDVPYRGKKRNDYILFSETASRFVVTIHPKDQNRFEKIMAGNVFSEIGFVSADGLFEVAGINGRPIVKDNINKLKEAWQKPLNF